MSNTNIVKKIDIQDIESIIKNIYNISQNKQYLPVMFWGAAGVGKSSMIRQSAKALGLDFIDLRLSLLNPVDLRGLPTINGENAKWLSPEFLPKNGKGILFLDEINLAPQSVMSAGYQLILDRRLGEYKLPDDWIILAAGNRLTDGANVNKMPAPLANRFIHYEIDNVKATQWAEYAMRHHINDRVVSFILKFPHYLCTDEVAGKTVFNTPRTWEYASILYDYGMDIGAAVGMDIDAEFKSFLRLYDKIPDVNLVLTGKDVSFPIENDIRYCFTVALSYATDEKTLPYTAKYFKRIPAEFSILGLNLLKNKFLLKDGVLHLSSSIAEEIVLGMSEELKDLLR